MMDSSLMNLVLSMLTMDWDYEETLKAAHEEDEKRGEKGKRCPGQKRGEEAIILVEKN